MSSAMNAICATYGDIWAIVPEKLTALADLYAAGIEPQAIKPRIPRVSGSIGILPLTGVMTQRTGGGLMELMFGGTKTDEFGQQFDAMIQNKAVGAVVLDIDSPGGSVFGLPELAAKIRAARGTKPIIAVANSTAASGAYFVATAADQLVVTPGGWVGSVGTLWAHADYSEAEKMKGIKVTYIYAGKFKVEANDSEPLSDEARENRQEQVNKFYGMFVDAVSKGRGVPPSRVKSDFGQGRMVLAEEAVERGMADRIGTLEEVVGKLAKVDRGLQRRALAEAELKLIGE